MTLLGAWYDKIFLEIKIIKSTGTRFVPVEISTCSIILWRLFLHCCSLTLGRLCGDGGGEGVGGVGVVVEEATSRMVWHISAELRGPLHALVKPVVYRAMPAAASRTYS